MLHPRTCLVLASSILLAPLARASSLEHGGFGSAPADKSVILTFESSANTPSSYLVDSKGYYEHGFWLGAGGTPLGGAAGNSDGGGDRGFTPIGVFADTFSSKGAGGNFSGPGGFLSTGGGGQTNGVGGFLAGSESSGFKGLGEGSGFGSGNKGPDLSHILLSAGPGFGPGSEGLRDVHGGSVSATPLPTSWTMMLIGLLAFGLLAWFRRSGTSDSRPRGLSVAAE